jgi:hypothetical protein
MVFPTGPMVDPELAKELAEDRQREFLDEAEADRMTDENPENDPKSHEKPVTDTEDNDFIPSPDHNTHIKKD